MENPGMELRGSCICPRCPTYNDCAKGLGEIVYCINGKSPSCIKKEKGCMCQSCLVYFRRGLKKVSYCTKGTPPAP